MPRQAAEEALRYLSEPGHPSIGAALYQLGELHRLRGELAAAERAYREASRHGREPSPGFELLRLAQGQVAAAVASIQRVVEETRGLRTHPAMLAAAVEVLLAAGDAAGGPGASEELGRLIVAGQVAPYVQAMAAYCSGSVLLAEGDAMGALVELRRAGAAWRDLEMPYDAARASVQIARACRALSDHDAADRQLETALETFEHLGARTDLARAGRLARSSGALPGRADRPPVRRPPGRGHRQVEPRGGGGPRHQRAHGRAGTCRTSSRSSTCRHGRRPRPTPTSTGSSDRRPRGARGQNGPRDAGPEDGQFGRCGRLAAFVRSGP